MVADELDVRAAEIHSQVLVVHEVVGGRLLEDGGKKHRSLVIDMVALGDVIDIVTELLDSIGGKAGGIYLTKNAVQAGRLGLDRLVLGNEVLLFKDGGFSFASHIRQFVFLFIPIDVRFLACSRQEGLAVPCGHGSSGWWLHLWSIPGSRQSHGDACLPIGGQ